MQTFDRRVRQLKITSQDESSVSADITAIKDAFNIASLPGIPPNGLLLVKSLDLGVIGSRSSSIAISNLIDSRIRQQQIPSFHRDEAEHSNDVVWFSDIHEAVVRLMKLVSEKKYARDWYWRVLLPSLRPNPEIVDIFLAVVRDLPRDGVRPQILASLVEVLVMKVPRAEITETLELPLVKQLAHEMRLFPSPVPDQSDEINRQAIALPGLSARWIEVIRNAVLSYGDQDPRCLWLAYCALILSNPSLVDNRMVWPTITALLREVKSTKGPGLRKPAKPALPGVDDKVAAERSTREIGLIDFDVDTGASTEAVKIDELKPPASLHCLFEGDEVTSESNFDIEGLINSEYGGFGFLISLMGMLSIDRLMEENPLLVEINFPVRVLYFLADRFGIDRQHPLVLGLPKKIDCGNPLIDEFSPPDDWNSLIRPSWKSARFFRSPTVEQLERLFVSLCSRYLYRSARMSLRRLLFRRGLVAVSRTHLDFVFDIEQVDIDLRRTGLDIDPGWVSWLAKVVQFHYRQEEPEDA